ncbi:peptidyl-prolyl cis-trans isomerase [archaeon]|jgi:peptidyl-prolyl cis-trans isomerase A (cyclophilin A)|nr:peptidyl-prolyl cis-trans isomerase [archaeon]
MVKKTKVDTERKRNIIIIGLSCFAVVLILLFAVMSLTNQSERVKIETSHGNIIIELYPADSPTTVENFLSYVDDGFYDDLVFHRVIPDFMIQGGGFDSSGAQKSTKAPIKLESNNGLKNTEYTIAMARTNAMDSATSQFFINTKDNNFLDYTVSNPGYAVFGEVVSGKEVVDAIEQVKTGTTPNDMQNWPVEEVSIYSIKRI